MLASRRTFTLGDEDKSESASSKAWKKLGLTEPARVVARDAVAELVREAHGEDVPEETGDGEKSLPLSAISTDEMECALLETLPRGELHMLRATPRGVEHVDGGASRSGNEPMS